MPVHSGIERDHLSDAVAARRDKDGAPIGIDPVATDPAADPWFHTRPSAVVDPLDVDLGLTGGTEHIDERAIAVARTGAYSTAIATDLSPVRLRRFFRRGNEQYQVTKLIRDTVLFAYDNVIYTLKRR